MPNAIVLDKCFLQGAPTKVIRHLAESHRLIVSDALFYELLTCPEPERSQCFAKFPQTANPVELVNHIGPLMKREIETHRPAGRPSQHKVDIQFKFNPALPTGNYEIPPEALIALEEQAEDLRSDVESLVEKANLTSDFFPHLLTGTTRQRALAREEAERDIVAPRSLLPFYEQLECPDPQSSYPPANLVDESWAIYRWLQVQMLFGLDLFVRYAGRVPQPDTEKLFTQLEHDVLDAQVLMLGCLEGAFATREKKLIRWWHLLSPAGKLYQ